MILPFLVWHKSRAAEMLWKKSYKKTLPSNGNNCFRERYAEFPFLVSFVFWFTIVHNTGHFVSEFKFLNFVYGTYIARYSTGFIFSCLDHTFPVHLFYQLYMQETCNLNISAVNRSFPVLLLLKKCSFDKISYVFSKFCSHMER